MLLVFILFLLLLAFFYRALILFLFSMCYFLPMNWIEVIRKSKFYYILIQYSEQDLMHNNTEREVNPRNNKKDIKILFYSPLNCLT